MFAHLVDIPPHVLRPILIYPNSFMWPAFFMWSKKLINLPDFGIWKRCVGEELYRHFLRTWHVSIWTTWAKVDYSLTWGLAKYPVIPSGARRDKQPWAEIPETVALLPLHLLGVGHEAISHPSPWFPLIIRLSASSSLRLHCRFPCKSLYLAIFESWLLHSGMTYFPVLSVIWTFRLSDHPLGPESWHHADPAFVLCESNKLFNFIWAWYLPAGWISGYDMET